jgi:hypothetical protein
MNRIRRNPYIPTVSTTLSTPTDYHSPALAYPSAPISAATSAIALNTSGYGDVNPGDTIPSPTDPYPISTFTSTAVPLAHLEISTPGQGAIIAISVICGLLLLSLLFAILIIIGRRHQSEQLRIAIEGGGGGGAHHRRKRRHRSEKTFADPGDTEMIESERRRGYGGMERPFFIPVPRPSLRGHGGVPLECFMDPRMGNVRNEGSAQGQQGREDVDEVGESETSTTRADGTRTERSGSEGRHHSSREYQGPT